MKADEVGKFKNPGGACPLALKVLEQMKCNANKLVAI